MKLKNRNLQGSEAQLHLAFNKQTADSWAPYAPHRSTVMSCVLRAAGAAASGDPPSKQRIAVLGAGNCNDIDLHTLAEAAEEIHLVDIDRGALERGVEKTPHASRIRLHAPWDLAAPLHALSGLPTDRETLEALAGVPQELPATGCNVVVSSGLLSQLMRTLVHHYEREKPDDVEAYFRVVKAVRRGHCNRIAAMLRPGGFAVLTLDLVASDSLPELLELTPSDQPRLQPLLQRIRTENHLFTGMNPDAVIAELNAMPSVDHVLPSAPWVWHVGPRAYLVMAVMFRRKTE